MRIVHPDLSFRSLSAEEISQHVHNIMEDGYSVIRGYVNGRDAAMLERSLDDIFAENQKHSEYATPGAPVGFQNVIKHDDMINNLVAYDRKFVALSTLGDHLEVLKFFLNDPYYGLIPAEDPNFILAQMNGRAGKVALPFHVDTRMVTRDYTTWSMQGYLAVGHLGAGNGGLVVIPGTHKSGVFPTKETTRYDEAIALDTHAGDLVLFSSQLHHATGLLNAEQKARWSILLTYRCWWCKQQFDLLSLVDPELYRGLSNNQKLLLGAASVMPSSINASPSSRVGYADLWNPPSAVNPG